MPIDLAELSPAERLAALPAVDRSRVLAELGDEVLEALRWDWRFWARPEQLPPEDDWRILVFNAGRGGGKSRSGSELVREIARKRPTEIGAFIAPTPADARNFMINGESGILAISPPSELPTYEPSKLLLTWPNGAQALVFTAAEPEAIRGPNLGWAWCDELAKWKYPRAAWDNLRFSLRAGRDPKTIVTTTPKPIPLLKEILGGKWPGTVVRRWSTYRNRANLAEPFLAELLEIYAGTRLGRQELEAEILEDVEGALWAWELVERYRLSPSRENPTPWPELAKIIVAVDPAFSEKGRDEAGIVVAGRGWDGRGYILEDYSKRGSPKSWAEEVVRAYDEWNADRLVVEDAFAQRSMVRTILDTVPGGNMIPITSAKCKMGKRLRAEPVVALYEQGKISHVGSLPGLEDQMTSWVPDEKPDEEVGSPDRVDALVHALTHLLLTGDRPATVSTAAHARIPGIRPR